MKELSELLSLEKSGDYQEALKRIQAMAFSTSGDSPVTNFNLKLLEQRLRARLHSFSKEEAQETSRSAKETPPIAVTQTWSAIITMWKRQDYLAEQLAAIRAQSIPPQEIIIILNESHIPESKIREIGGADLKIIRCDINSLYSRWAVAYIAKGDYVSVFDDDVIPGEYWIANAIRVCSSYNALVGPAGRIHNKSGIHGYYKLVVPDIDGQNTINCSETDVYCDWVCNSYLFKREWVGHILNNVRYKDSFKTFDDIQLAISLYLSGGIRCVTPMQPSFDKRLHGSLQHQYGNDAHAIWKTNSDQHFSERKAYLESLIQDGYVPVQQRESLFRFHLIMPFGERTYLERCLLSVKGQDYHDFTCTLIDDCCDGGDALDLLRRLGLDGARFRYIKTTKKAYPLRAREIATDMLGANPADVIVHLDGDDWLPYPDVLSRLNRIYRRGGVLASYGNAMCIRNHESRDFSEYSQYDMSRKWNVAQKDANAKVLPFRRIDAEEISNGWGDAPWCGMHLRTFQSSKWMGLNRKTFFDKKGDYLRVATDAAILIPILDACNYASVAFVPDLAYVYQNAGNTIHAKNEISAQQKAAALAAVASADQVPDHRSVSQILIDGISPVAASDVVVIHDALHTKPEKHRIRVSFADQLGNTPSVGGSIMTIVTPNYLADAIVCLMSYRRNLQCDCQAYVFVATNDPIEISACTKMLESSGLKALFPVTLQYTCDQSHALAQKYSLSSDEYRWAMKAVVLLELLRKGSTLALFLDPDTYTVSDITDVHKRLAQHSISVFPHFRDPDHEYLRGVLYKDGFFNGGMLAATSSGIPHLARLYDRCLHELVKDPSRHRWDDQKYFDLFALEVEHLHVNLDRGIDYNYWNYEPIDGLVSPSQRSYLLGSGYFARHWHVSTALIRNSIELKEKRFSVYRPLVSIYLMSLLYTLVLLLAQAKRKGLASGDDFLGLLSRYNNIEEKLKQLSVAIPVNETRRLLALTLNDSPFDPKDFLDQWSVSLLKSICFDNFELFAQILESLFPDQDFVVDIKRSIRKRDLRYIADEVVGAHDLSKKEAAELLEVEGAGELVRKQLQALQACKIGY